MISSIEITRFRGIREGKLEDLTPLVVLVGPNGCGKSSVLDAMLVGASPQTGEGVGRAVLRHQGIVDKARWLFWKAEEKSHPQIIVTTRNKSRRECKLSLHLNAPDNAPSIKCNVKWTIVSSAPLRTSTSSSTTTMTSFPAGQYQFGGEVPAFEDVPDLRLVETRGDGLQVPLHQLYTEAARAGRREEARAIIAEVVPQMRDIEILTEADKPILYLVYESYAVPVALAGDGIHTLVRATFELVSRPNGVVLFEEPEVHQHPGAIHQTARAILTAARRDIQVVLTTHSLELIDSLLMQSSDEDLERLSVYRLHLEDGILNTRRMPGSEVAFLRKEIENDLR